MLEDLAKLLDSMNPANYVPKIVVSEDHALLMLKMDILKVKHPFTFGALCGVPLHIDKWMPPNMMVYRLGERTFITKLDKDNNLQSYEALSEWKEMFDLLIEKHHPSPKMEDQQNE